MSLVKIGRVDVSNLKAQTDMNSQQMVSIMDTVEDRQGNNPLFKAIIPEFLYKPPFGFPRNINVTFLRNLAKNPYVNSVIKTLQDEITTVKWDINAKGDIELSEQEEKDRMLIKEFINNPNDDDESFGQILRKTINDFIVLDSPCWVKVYNPLGELIQFRYVDGGTMVKNPDEYGRIGGREDFIFDAPQPVKIDGENRNIPGVTGSNGVSNSTAFDSAITLFRSMFADKAAYFQFSNTLQTSMPIPFGKKEIIYMISNPSPETPYSFASPLQASVDVILSLMFGSKYNLDFYMNGNTPEGIIQMAGAKPDQINALRDRLNASMYNNEKDLGVSRRVGYRLPVTNSEDTKFIPLNFSSREMEIIAQQEWFIKVLWANVGVTPAEMGFGQQSNKATDENQSKVAARKGITPLLNIIEYYINTQLINELPNGKIFEFKFDDFDIGEAMKKRQLQQAEINMGIKTWQMIAAEEGVDLNKLKSDKDENMESQMGFGNQDFGPANNLNSKNGNKDKMEDKKTVEEKSISLSGIVSEVIKEIEETGEELVNDALK